MRRIGQKTQQIRNESARDAESRLEFQEDMSINMDSWLGSGQGEDGE